MREKNKPPCPMEGCEKDASRDGGPCVNCRSYDWRWRQRTLVDCMGRVKTLNLWRNRMDARIQRGRKQKAKAS